MCSFIFTNKAIDNLDYINYYTKKRGPDHTEVTTIDAYHIIHNLLSITGDFTPQPFIDNNIVCFYNGQIYNYQDFDINCRSDGEILIPLYQQYGVDFIEKLEGEFALVLMDLTKQQLIVSTDTFATKPLWFSIESGDIGIASYASALQRLGFKQVEPFPANTTRVYQLSDYQLLQEKTIRTFDLEQHKTHYDDWLAAFSSAIKKRTQTTENNIFIGLSSGYDSGAIAAELIKQHVDFKAYSLYASENAGILTQRLSIIKNQQTLELSQQQYQDIKNNINTHCEDLTIGDYHFKQDKGATGVGAICQMAKQDNRKIHLSGQGADEIISDYGRFGEKIYSHSTLAGHFPDDLSTVFPWQNFFKGTQRQYLSKEEYVGGAYGLETRYPFLDINLVQEFLWLSPKLKNQHYKAPLHVYLSQSEFPFEQNEKIGFQANKNLRNEKKHRIKKLWQSLCSRKKT